jgi:hypothetical protein
MNTQANQRPPDCYSSSRHLAKRVLFAAVLGVAASMLSTVAAADDFANVYYDPKTDELVVTMNYSGTNPDHVFSLQWGECQTLANSSIPEIVADVNDSQSRDAARQDFKTTTRFSLENLSCRPAKLTLRTAPRFFYALQIPARTTPPQ